MALQNPFWTPRRTRLLAFGALAAAAFASLYHLATDTSAASLLKRGDFPAFYGAAAIACSGQLDHLYDPQLQHKMQTAAWPSLGDSFYAFAYPPYVAQLLAPVCSLSPLAAKGAATAAMIVCLAVCALLIRRQAAPNGGAASIVLVFSGLFLFAPVMIAVLAGQNAALSMLLYAGQLYLLRTRGKSGEFAAGLLAGAWCFKPQFGLLAVLLAGCASVRMLAGALVLPFIFFCAAAISLGIDWPAAYLQQAAAFSAQDIVKNGHQMVSLFGAAEAAGASLHCSTGGRTLLKLAALAASCGLVAAAAAVLRTSRKRRREDGRDFLAEAWLLIGPLALLASPHAMFYDLGLCLIPLAIAAPHWTERRRWAFAALLAVSFLVAAIKQELAVQPLILVAGYAYWSALKHFTRLWQAAAHKGR